MAKLNPTQTAIAAAFANYKTGSVAVVRAFEQTIHNFWHVDSMSCENVAFFINTAKRFPVLQKIAVGLLSKKDEKALAYLEIKKVKGKDEYTVRNSAGKDAAGNELPITKEMKVIARENVRRFIANEYTSLTHEKGVKVEVKFDADKGAASIRAAIVNQVKAMLVVNGDVDTALIHKMIADATAEALRQDTMAKTKKAADELKAKVEAAAA